MRISCPSCKWTVFEKTDHCPNCGGQLPDLPESVSLPEKTPKNGTPKVARACELMRGLPKIHVAPEISEKRLATVRGHFGIPENEDVLLVCDTTFFGSNREGFALTSWGIRWKNDSSVPSRIQALSWEDVRKHPFCIDGSAFRIGNDAVINVPGLLVKTWRERFLSMLAQIGATPRT